MEADFGCKERSDNEPLMVLVTLEADDGRVLQFEVEDAWLTEQEIDEGDEWPDKRLQKRPGIQLPKR